MNKVELHKYEHIDLLKQMVDQKYVLRNKHPQFDLYIYNYAPLTQFEKNWNVATLDARGLILDENDNVIARPFKKFFNVQEHANADIPWHENYTISSKEDGSLGITYVGPDGVVRIATRGSFVSDQSIWATKWLDSQPELVSLIKKMDSTTTLLFEIIFKSNKIVVDYGEFEGLIHIGGIDKKTGLHLNVDSYPTKAGVRAATVFNVAHLPSFLLNQRDNFEGYVIRFMPSGFTVKYKMEDYVRLHKIVTNTSNVVIWEYLASSTNLDHILTNIPDEFYDWVKLTIAELQSSYDEILLKVVSAHNHITYNLVDATRKDIANYLFSQHADVAHIVFSVLDNKYYAKMIWDKVRPEYRKPYHT